MSLKIYRPVAMALALGLTTVFSQAIAAPFDSLTVSQEGQQFEAYKQVYIAPITMELDQRQTSRNRRFSSQRDPFVPQEDQDEKAEDLHTSLTRALGKHYEISAVPGPGILTISPKLTRLIPSRLTPAAQAANLGLDFQGTVYAGGATFNVTLSEGETVLATLVDRYDRTLADQTPRVAFWQDADEAFNAFSRKLTRYIRKS